jgi:IS605 OrfB family transposase
MRVTLTAKLTTTPEQAVQLRRTALAYRAALNYTSRVAFASGKTANKVMLQKLVYRDVRARFCLSARLACNVPRQVASTYKGLWTRVAHNAQHRANGYTKKRYKGLDKPPTHVSLTTAFSYGYDYRFKTGQQVSLTTLDGRLVLPYQGYTRHLAYIKAGRQFDEAQKESKRRERKELQVQHGELSEPELSEEEADARYEQELNQAMLNQLTLPLNAEPEDATALLAEDAPDACVEANGITFGAAKLWRDPRTKQWYLLVALEIPQPDVTPTTCPRTKGIDLGQRYVAVSTPPDDDTQFISGGQVVHQGEAYQRVRKRLQKKGTRKATGRLRQMTLRERRFKADVNHVTANSLVEPGMLIGLEDLSHIRERTRQKGKKQRRKASKLAFAELKSFVNYKALLAGSIAITVDADYTSQQCPLCTHRSQANWPNTDLRFRCANLKCGFGLHADLVGARQVCLRTLVVRQDWVTTGRLSPSTNGASGEAKAARLQRYAELRWRTALSPQL